MILGPFLDVPVTIRRYGDCREVNESVGEPVREPLFFVRLVYRQRGTSDALVIGTVNGDSAAAGLYAELVVIFAELVAVPLILYIQPHSFSKFWVIWRLKRSRAL